MESSDRRSGGRLGLAGGVRSGRGHVHVGQDGGHHVLGEAGQVNGQVRLINSRHGLAHRVQSIVNRTMVSVPGEGSSSHGRSRLGLTGRRRVRAPVTQWPPQHVPNQGGASSDTEEHVHDEPEEGANEEAMDNGSVDDIVQKVQQAFDEHPAERNNRIFLTLQDCMREVLEQLGGNRYKVPHMRKEVLQRLGTLPVTLQCTANFVKWAIDSLQDA
ncbi:hypothetical protein ACQ4PT_021375 [Festuca glaucescens]